MEAEDFAYTKDEYVPRLVVVLFRKCKLQIRFESHADRSIIQMLNAICISMQNTPLVQLDADAQV